jgi:hypothetical protein
MQVAEPLGRNAVRRCPQPLFSHWHFRGGHQNTGMKLLRDVCWLMASMALCTAASGADEGFRKLFPKDGVPEGWSVRAWDDVKNPGPPGAEWKVIDGVLHGSNPRGTWLVSDKQYSNFVLKYEFKLGERGNSGCGLRFPGFGDPAFDGLELQMVDPRYYPPDFGEVPANELTGGLYRAVAPSEQLYKPGEWNSYEISLQGPLVKVTLNGKPILDYNLDKHTTIVKRHNGQDAVPLRDRPRTGHIGFQELSRAGGHVEIRNAQIKELKPSAAGRITEQSADGSVLLHARDVTVHGDMVRYEPEPHKNTIGYWMKKEDWVSWKFKVNTPGTFKVEALQGCGPGSGGSEVRFVVGDQSLKMKVQETKHFQDFIPRELGSIKLAKAGEYQLEVRPETKPGLAVMDLRQVRLIPAK